MIGLLIGLLLGLLLPAAAVEPCPDREEALAAAEHAVLWADEATAREALERVEDALACGPVADPRSVARLFWAEAALLRSLQDPIGAAEAVAAAARMQAGPPPEAYGDTLGALPAPVSSSEGRLDVFVIPEGHRVALDGRVVAVPTPVPAGPHLVQVARSRRRVAWAEVVSVQPGVDLMVQTGLPGRVPRVRAPRPLLTGIGIGLGAAGSWAPPWSRDPRRSVPTRTRSSTWATPG